MQNHGSPNSHPNDVANLAIGPTIARTTEAAHLDREIFLPCLPSFWQILDEKIHVVELKQFYVF